MPVNPKVGRPRALTAELKAEFCERIGAGETVLEISRDDRMPVDRVMYEELVRDPEFAQSYRSAREQQLRNWEDRILEVSERAMRGEVEVPAAKLHADNLKWIMSKRQPRVYGDRIAQEVSGPAGGPIELSPLEAARRVAFVLAAGQHELARQGAAKEAETHD